MAMAARVRKIRHDEETRAKIQTSQLINRLQGHALGKIEMTPAQVRSAEILLGKTIPNLSSVEMKADVTERRVVSDKPMSDDEWAERYANDIMGTPAGASESTH